MFMAEKNKSMLQSRGRRGDKMDINEKLDLQEKREIEKEEKEIKIKQKEVGVCQV